MTVRAWCTRTALGRSWPGVNFAQDSALFSNFTHEYRISFRFHMPFLWKLSIPVFLVCYRFERNRLSCCVRPSSTPSRDRKIYDGKVSSLVFRKSTEPPSLSTLPCADYFLRASPCTASYNFLCLCPVVTAVFPLEEACAALEAARKKGTLKVQIICSDSALWA